MKFFPNFQKMKVMQSKNKLDTSNKYFFAVLQKCKIRCHVILLVTN